jgi:hypothetical protein
MGEGKSYISRQRARRGKVRGVWGGEKIGEIVGGEVGGGGLGDEFVGAGMAKLVSGQWESFLLYRKQRDDFNEKKEKER